MGNRGPNHQLPQGRGSEALQDGGDEEGGHAGDGAVFAAEVFQGGAEVVEVRARMGAIEASARRISLNTRMIRMLISMAAGERRTPLNMATPFSVKAWGMYFRCCPRPPFMVPIWHLRHSSRESWNMKSGGKRSMFRLTCRFSCLASTP